MRKLIWCCTACGVLLAGGLFWAAQYAVHHPETAIGHALTGFSRLTVILNPATGIAPMLAEKVWHTSTKTVCEEQDCAGESAPGEPVPDPEGEKTVTDPVPTPVESPLKVLGHVEVHAPTAIVIPEEEVPQTREPSTADMATFQTPNGQTELTVVSGSKPVRMSHCEADCSDDLSLLGEEEELPAPTRLANEDHLEGSAQGCATHTGCKPEKMKKCEVDASWFLDLLGMPRCTEPATETEEGHKACESEAISDAEKEREAAHEAHQQTCPYTGRCYPQCYQSMQKKPKGEGTKQPGAEEDSEEPQPTHKKHMMEKEGDETPRHFEVDTMEFRPSDGSLSDYGPDVL